MEVVVEAVVCLLLVLTVVLAVAVALLLEQETPHLQVHLKVTTVV